MDNAIVMVLEKISFNIRRLYDEAIFRLVYASIKESSEKRCTIEEVVFNFSRRKLSDNMMDILGLGANYVFNDIVGPIEARKKYEGELLLYLQKYRRFIEKGEVILKRDIGEWLEEANADYLGESKHKKFYQMVYSMYDSLFFGRIVMYCFISSLNLPEGLKIWYVFV